MPNAIPEPCAASSCAVFFCAGRRRSTGSSTACSGLSRSLARLCRVSPRGGARDLLAGYYRRLIDPDPRVHLPAARAWSVYEGACSTLLPNPETVAAFGEDRLALGLARIEAHYFTFHLFPPERDLLARIGRIRHLPAVIVQGRYDMVCPIRSADELARAWPEAEYIDRARRRAFGDGAGDPRAADPGHRARQGVVMAARPYVRDTEMGPGFRRDSRRTLVSTTAGFACPEDDRL